MTMPTIERIRSRTLRISERTEWTFLEVTASDGVVGHGEASINGMTEAFKAHTAALAARLVGRPATPNRVAVAGGDAAGGLVQSAVASAVEQALWDGEGRRLGVPVTRLLGGTVRERVPVYANINRRTRERTPDGFAASARLALDAGYRFVKLAPFDGAGEGDLLGDDARVAAGLARIAGVVDAVGESAGVLVDCHWRLSETAAVRVIDFAAEHGLFWVECPVAEGPSRAAMLRRVRAHALSRGVRLAGLEKGERLADFVPAIEEGHYDVLMPDVKYGGGLAATRSIADLAATAGVEIALHNPTGPVCHAASVAASATLANALILEVQFGESPLFAALTCGEEMVVTDSTLPVSEAPGLGITLDAALMEEIEIR